MAVYSPETASARCLDRDAHRLNLPKDFVETTKAATGEHNEGGPDLSQTDTNRSNIPEEPPDSPVSSVVSKISLAKPTWDQPHIKAKEMDPTYRKRVLRGKLIEKLGEGQKQKNVS